MLFKGWVLTFLCCLPFSHLWSDELSPQLLYGEYTDGVFFGEESTYLSVLKDKYLVSVGHSKEKQAIFRGEYGAEAHDTTKSERSTFLVGIFLGKQTWKAFAQAGFALSSYYYNESNEYQSFESHPENFEKHDALGFAFRVGANRALGKYIGIMTSADVTLADERHQLISLNLGLVVGKIR